MFTLNIWTRFEVIKTLRYWSLKKTATSYKEKCVDTENPLQNIWNKVKKLREIGHK